MSSTDDHKRAKALVAVFKMPSVQTIVARKSSVTNAFVSSLLPTVVPSADEIEEALLILGMHTADVHCTYCGDPTSEWDHLRPLVLNRRPTGFISEIANLVPACGKCNQSKGNKYWRDWMLGTAPRSPKQRGVADVDERVARLETFERWRPPTKIDFAAIVGKDEWDAYWASCENVIKQMSDCQENAAKIVAKISTHLPR